MRFRDIYADVNNKAAIPGIVADVEAFAQTVQDPIEWVPVAAVRVNVKSPIPIFDTGRAFWVGGEFFPSVKEARDYAVQIAGNAPQSARQ